MFYSLPKAGSFLFWVIYMKKTTLLLVVIMLISCFTGSYVEAAEQYVTVSFEDYSLRANENCDFPKPLGKIIGKTKVKIQDRDTIATVTLRLLSQLNIDAYYSGNAEMGGGFYLESIDNFTAENGKRLVTAMDWVSFLLVKIAGGQ